MELRDFLSRLEGVERGGEGQYSARCPAHDDQHQSLSISTGRNSDIVVHCHAGCPPEDVVGAVDLAMGDLFHRPTPQEAFTQRQAVASYDYTDETGALLYRKVRYEPKGFSQCRPDGKGGWVHNLKGIKKVLFNLPAVLSSDTVWIVEGEKNVQTLTQRGLVATCSGDGAGTVKGKDSGKWLLYYKEWLHGKNVIILPDNDSVGKAFALEVANDLLGAAQSVKLADLTTVWAEIPEHGDVTDLFEHCRQQNPGHGDEVGMALLSTLMSGTPEHTFRPISEAERWEVPTPFNEEPHLPSFPVHALPDHLREYVEAVAESIQVPVDMTATCALSTCALCIQKKYKVKGKPEWFEPLNLFTIVVAAPAERKSAVTTLMTAPLFRYEEACNAFLQPLIDEYEIKHNVLTKKIKALEDVAAKPGKSKPGAELDWNAPISSSISDVLDKRAELAALEAAAPKKLRLWTDDATMEALTSLLADNGGKMGVISAEGGIFETLNGRYTNGVNIDIFLKAHAGDSVRVDRKGRPSEYIKNPAMTVFLAIQPVVLDGLMGNDAFRGRGLTARFLYSMPTTTVGGRVFETAAIPPNITDQYSRMIDELLAIQQPDAEHILELSTQAYEMSRAFFYELEPRLKGDLDGMGDWAGKLHGAILRVAGVLHVVRHRGRAQSVDISGETMEGALLIGRYFLEHAKAVYRLMGADKQTSDAKYILRQLEKGQHVQVTQSELTRMCRRFCKAEDMRPGVEMLIEYGYLREVQTDIGYNNRKLISYKINPAAYGIDGIHGNFAS